MKAKLAGTAAVAVATSPVAAWWLIGDRSQTAIRSRDLDYIARAPDVPDWVTTTVGSVALVLAVASVSALIRAARRDALDSRWMTPVATLMLAGVLLALIGRVATAGVIGANIGGGLALFFLGPIEAALVAFAILRGLSLLRRRVSAGPV